MYKQIIISRKDLGMSSGKLAAQVAHASMAFLTSQIKNNNKITYDCSIGHAWTYSRLLPAFDDGREPQLYRRNDLNTWAKEARDRGDDEFYFELVDKNDPKGELRLCEKKYHIESTLSFGLDLFNEWINGSFTKVILEAKNRKHLEKAVCLANELGLAEGKDFFLIKDNCLTELEPEEVDDNGQGRTLTCIGFIPLDSETADKIGRKYQLWK